MENKSNLSPASLRMIRVVDGIVLFVAKHWLALAATALFIFIALPWLAPVLLHAGYVDAAGLIYTVYGMTCHQLAYRSYFVFGDQAAYTVNELQAHLQVSNPALDVWYWRGFLGDAQMGYKVAFCERDVAIYSTLLLSLLAFGIARRFREFKPLSLRWFLIVFVPPIAIDGFTQLFGLRESDPLLRTLTGGWFALGSAWLTFPIVEEAMRDLYAQTAYQLERVRARERSKSRNLFCHNETTTNDKTRHMVRHENYHGEVEDKHVNFFWNSTFVIRKLHGTRDAVTRGVCEGWLGTQPLKIEKQEDD